MIIKNNKKKGPAEFLIACLATQIYPFPIIFFAVTMYAIALWAGFSFNNPSGWTALMILIVFLMHGFYTLVRAKDLVLTFEDPNTKFKIKTANTEAGLGESLVKIFEPFENSLALSVSVTGISGETKIFTIEAHVNDSEKEELLESLGRSFSDPIELEQIGPQPPSYRAGRIH